MSTNSMRKQINKIADSLESRWIEYQYENWTREDHERLNFHKCQREYFENECLEMGLSENLINEVLKTLGY